MENNFEAGTSTDMIQYTPKRLSATTVLSLMADDLQNGKLRTTIGIKFADEEVPGQNFDGFYSQ